IQGLTEFLPVSSSGHLVLAKHFLNVHSAGAELEILLHAATCLAVMIYFLRDFTGLLFKKSPSTDFKLSHVLIACCITGSVGFVIKDAVVSLFDKPIAAALCLLIMGSVLLLSKRIPEGSGRMTLQTAIMFGCIQIIALLPGISRSGITIVLLMLAGIDRHIAFRFSFVASLPLIIAASFFQVLDGMDWQVLTSYVPGFISAFAFGWFALAMLEKCIIMNKFHLFGYYCLIFGLLAGSALIIL
ncbi:MAG: undecaprenyl-diphosphate phosphatase, partial [Candidatus Omnitrophica bacterium]|nr:undecaprenyl-diphosphate phosphatase [Candidatus Omnitrophota bacterium]